MAIFKLTARSGGLAVLVRARCLSCARKVAVERSPAEEFGTWSDPALSTVELLFGSRHDAAGPDAVLERV